MQLFNAVYPTLYLLRVFLGIINALDHHLFICCLFGYCPELEVKDCGVRLLGTGFVQYSQSQSIWAVVRSGDLQKSRILKNLYH